MVDDRASVLGQIRAIRPSHDGATCYRPAQVTLESGETYDRVYCVPSSDLDKRWSDHRLDGAIGFEEVARVRESPYRLPAQLADRLYAEGESGMGYTIFTLVMKDGMRVPRVTGNYVDFPALPEGSSAADIHDVLPHEGRDCYRDRPAERTPPFRWLFYPDT